MAEQSHEQQVATALCPRVARPHSRSGTVLVIVLVVIVLLTYASYRFVDRAAVEDLAAHARSDLARLTTCLDSGEELLIALLALSPVEREAFGGMVDNSKIFQGQVVYGDERSSVRYRMTVIAPRLAEDEVVGLRFGLINESSKLSLRALLDWDRRQPGSARRALLQLPGMDPPTADALLDWIDPDSMRREDGAEAADYGAEIGGNRTTRPANALPTALDELLSVRGVSRAELFGADQNANFHTSAYEHQTQTELANDRFQTESMDGLPWYYDLTIHSGERNTSQNGRARIDLNETNLQQLRAVLASRFSDHWANFIIAYRQYGPADPTADAKPARDIRIDDAAPAVYRIESIYDLLGAEVLIPGRGSAKPRMLGSPFQTNPTELRRYLLEFADQVTTDARPVIPGRVNINEASGRVLRGVPGLERELSKQILATRGNQGTRVADSRYHEAWLLAEGLVDLPQMKGLAPYVTTRGDIFRAQMIGFADRGSQAVRETLVVDATVLPPRTVLRHDLRRFGRGYSLDVLLGDRLLSIEGNP